MAYLLALSLAVLLTAVSGMPQWPEWPQHRREYPYPTGYGREYAQPPPFNAQPPPLNAQPPPLNAAQPPPLNAQPPPLGAKVDSGIPVVGDTWGPLITHAGKMRTTADGLRHTYYYGQTDVLADDILPAEIFSNKYEMRGYLQSKVDEDSIVVQLEPEILEGKYVEVLTSKAISPAAIKLVCHSFNTSPAFCHDVVNSSHKAKLMFSMVKSTDSGNVFPIVFFSHEGCSEDNSCFWVTHVNEVVVLDKSVV